MVECFDIGSCSIVHVCFEITAGDEPERCAFENSFTQLGHGGFSRAQDCQSRDRDSSQWRDRGSCSPGGVSKFRQFRLHHFASVNEYLTIYNGEMDGARRFLVLLFFKCNSACFCIY